MRWNEMLIWNGSDGEDKLVSYDSPKEHSRKSIKKALKSFKEHGSMIEWFFDFGGDPHEDKDDPSTWGPQNPGEIDWTGFDVAE